VTGKVSATFYAAVVPVFRKRWISGAWEDRVDNLKVKRIWQSRPDKAQIQAGTVVVKLTVRFNEDAFLPLAPAAVIDIPDSMVQAGQVVEVEALDENDLAVAEHLAKMAKGVT
jgi:hypothetical protein